MSYLIEYLVNGIMWTFDVEIIGNLYDTCRVTDAAGDMNRMIKGMKRHGGLDYTDRYQ